MILDGARAGSRLLALLAALAVAVGVAACGDSGDGDGGGGASASVDADTSSDTVAGGGAGGVDAADGGPEAQIRAVVDGVQRAMREGDAKHICDNLTEAAREAAAERAAPGPGAGGCVENFAEIASLRIKGAPFPTVTSVDVEGDRATVKLKLSDGRPDTVEAVREDGAWKIDLSNVSPTPATTDAPPAAPKG